MNFKCRSRAFRCEPTLRCIEPAICAARFWIAVRHSSANRASVADEERCELGDAQRRREDVRIRRRLRPLEIRQRHTARNHDEIVLVALNRQKGIDRRQSKRRREIVRAIEQRNRRRAELTRTNQTNIIQSKLDRLKRSSQCSYSSF